MPSILGSFASVTLRTFAWWLCWNIVTVSTVMQGAQHCGQDGRDFLVIMEKCQQGTGESTRPRPPLPLLLPVNKTQWPEGLHSCLLSFIIALCEVFL